MTYQFPPRPLCPGCRGKLEWVEASGRATLRTWTVVRRATHARLADWLPYALAIVHLEEGVNLCSHVVGLEPEQLVGDLPLTVTIVRTETQAFPVFSPGEVPEVAA